MDRIKTILPLLLLITLWMRPAAAATNDRQIVLRTTVGDVRSGDIIPVEVRLDSAGEMINAAEVHVAYPAKNLEYLRTSREQSIFTLWPEEPTNDVATSSVSLMGGRPGGLIAVQGQMATLYFRVLQSGSAQVSVLTATSAFFANDGEGTRLAVTAQSAVVGANDAVVSRLVLESTSHATTETWGRLGTIEVHWTVTPEALYSYQLSSNITDLPDDTPDVQVGRVEYLQQPDGIYYFTLKERLPGGQWSQPVQRAFWLDSHAPEPFALSFIGRQTLDGIHDVVSWQATDQASGVAHYRLRGVGDDRDDVVSPLALLPAWYGKRITIVAVDTAGNERSASLALPSNSGKETNGIWSPLVLGGTLLLIILAIGLGLFVRRDSARSRGRRRR